MPVDLLLQVAGSLSLVQPVKKAVVAENHQTFVLAVSGALYQVMAQIGIMY